MSGHRPVWPLPSDRAKPDLPEGSTYISALLRTGRGLGSMDHSEMFLRSPAVVGAACQLIGVFQQMICKGNVLGYAHEKGWRVLPAIAFLPRSRGRYTLSVAAFISTLARPVAAADYYFERVSLIQHFPGDILKLADQITPSRAFISASFFILTPWTP